MHVLMFLLIKWIGNILKGDFFSTILFSETNKKDTWIGPEQAVEKFECVKIFVVRDFVFNLSC